MLPQKAVLYEEDQAYPSGKQFVGIAAAAPTACRPVRVRSRK
jgi:hypothetical protein